MRRGVRAAATLLPPIIAAGCLSGTPTATPVPSVQPLPTPTVTVYTPASTAWVDGFEVTLTRATAALDAKGGPVDVILTVQNPGDQDAALDVPVSLTSGANTFGLAPNQDVPEVSAGGFAEMRLEFEVLGLASIDDGVLRIGRPADHTVALPLGSNTSALVTLEPVEQNLTGIGRAGNLRASLRHAEVRWDLPDWHDELPLATKALTVRYDVTNLGTFSGGTAFTADNIQLRLPDGTLVSPRQDGHSQTIVLIDAGKIAHGVTSRFEIPADTSGQLALVLKDGSTTRAIPFTIGT